MKTKYRKPLIYATAVVIPQLVAFLIDNSQGIAFLISLITLLAYELYSKTVDAREALLSAASFTSTALLISALSKELIYSSLCEVSRSVETTDMASVLPSQQTCLSVLEIFVKNLSANPISTWYFWISSIAVAASTVYLYRTYSEDR